MKNFMNSDCIRFSIMSVINNQWCSIEIVCVLSTVSHHYHLIIITHLMYYNCVNRD